MKYYFIVNPGSRTGHGKELWGELEKTLKNSKTEFEAYFTEGPGDATRFAKKICSEHPEMKRVVIVGGDGTADEAINGLFDYSRIILGYIPTGSANDLARGLKLSNDPKKALEHVIHPRTFRKIDHGMVTYYDTDGDTTRTGTRKFAVSSGVGYDADICYEADRSKLKTVLNKLHLGGLIYYLFGIKLIFTNKRAKVTITIDGKRQIITRGLLFAAAMNTKYEGGGMPMNPSADPTDQKVSMCIVHDVSRFGHIRLMPTILNSTHIYRKGVEQITCTTCEIEADRPLVVHTDGEFAGKHKHIVFSCVPEQIRMMF